MVFLFIYKIQFTIGNSTLYISEDNKSVVVGVGNKGFRVIKILDVTVNNGDQPMKTRLQVSNALQGFIITNDDTDDKAKKNDLPDTIGKVAIKTGTSPSSRLKN